MKKSLTLIIGFIALNLSAQKYELGKVTMEELKETKHVKDTAAVAAVLFKKGNVFFEYSESKGFEMILQVQTKIKIYKKDGYDYANHSIRYYDDGGTKERVFISDAVSYNLVDNKIVKSKLKKEGEFEEKISKYRKVKKITMPDVRVGSILEFKYEIHSPLFGELRDWVFQDEIPVNYSEYETKIPEYFVYNVQQKGSLTPLTKVDRNSKSIKIQYKDTSRPGAITTENEVVNYEDVLTKYVLQNIPAINNEKFVNNINNYIATTCYELSAVKYPNALPKYYSTDWESVVAKIYEDENFGNELNKTGYFEKEVTDLLQGITSREEKIATIFNYVKSTVNWNEYYGYTCDDGVKSAYKNKTGNIAEINLMLTAMLRYAGLEANPVLLSTRDNGIAFFPSRGAFNYVVTGVEVENNIILLDATSKYALPNILPTRDLNWFGRVIRKSGSSAQVDLMPKFISKDYITTMAAIKVSGEIEGKIREQHFDYNAYSFRVNNNGLSEDNYLEKLEKKLNNSEVSEYNIENKSDLSKPIVETFSFKNNNAVEIISDKLYFSPMLFFAETINPFKQDKREYPIDFTYPNQDKYLTILEIPEGYVVESIPNSVNVKFSDDFLEYKFTVAVKDNKVQMSSILDINTPILSPDYYEELKLFFNEMIKKQTEKIILKKV